MQDAMQRLDNAVMSAYRKWQSDLFPEQRGATFSEDRLYRYALWRRWDDRPKCNFLMLNPSTADETENDQTVERCERRARQWGYGGLIVTNLFALCSRDPERLKEVDDPIGIGNNDAILREAKASGIVVCAWGIHGKYRGRGRQVREFLDHCGVKLHCLNLTKHGEPIHPLYVPYSVVPREFPLCHGG